MGPWGPVASRTTACFWIAAFWLSSRIKATEERESLFGCLVAWLCFRDTRLARCCVVPESAESDRGRFVALTRNSTRRPLPSTCRHPIPTPSYHPPVRSPPSSHRFIPYRPGPRPASPPRLRCGCPRPHARDGISPATGLASVSGCRSVAATPTQHPPPSRCCNSHSSSRNRRPP
jgi:hypothetical protein